MKCPNCEKYYSDSSPSCPYCGASKPSYNQNNSNSSDDGCCLGIIAFFSILLFILWVFSGYIF